MTTIYGASLEEHDQRWSPDHNDRREAITQALDTLLDIGDTGIDEIDPTEPVAIVPDVHYPFHPSTGMVTDPAVVDSLLETLETTDVAIAGVADPRIDLERCWEYLGWDHVTNREKMVDLAAEPTVRRQARVGTESVAVDIPTPLLERTVIVVPTLRPTRAGPVAGGMRTLARSIGGDDDQSPTAEEIAATTATVDPACTLLDATIAFAGEPAATGTLLGGESIAVDAVGSTLLGRDPADDPAIAQAAAQAGGRSISVSGVDLSALEASLPSGSLPPATESNPLVPAAYRLYAAVSGDAVPPQLEQ